MYKTGKSLCLILHNCFIPSILTNKTKIFKNRRKTYFNYITEAKVSQILQGQFSGIHFFIFPMKTFFYENFILTIFEYGVPNSGTIKRCRMSAIIYRYDIAALYETIFHLENVPHYFRC